MQPQTQITRNKMIASIKITQKQNNLDDATYRAFLQNCVGKTSCTACTDHELLTIIEALKGKSFKPHVRKLNNKGKSKKIDFTNTESRANIVTTLWSDCCRLGHFENRSNLACDAFVMRQTGISSVKWLKTNNHFNKVINALKAKLNQKPKTIPADPNAIMTFHGADAIMTYGNDEQKIAYEYRHQQLSKY